MFLKRKKAQKNKIIIIRVKYWLKKEDHDKYRNLISDKEEIKYFIKKGKDIEKKGKEKEK